MLVEENFHIYTQSTAFIDSDASNVIDFAWANVAASQSETQKGIALYYAVRDHIRYSPYGVVFDRDTFKASRVLEKGVGFCVHKAVLLAAVARVVSIPSRLGFADVRNHLVTERLAAWMRTEDFIYHGYTELYLDGKWVKVTPAFNLSLCERFNVRPLEFDGKNDSIFHPLDMAGNKHMEYLRDHGQYADLPFKQMVRAFQEGYPHLFKESGLGWPDGNFEREASEDAVKK